MRELAATLAVAIVTLGQPPGGWQPQQSPVAERLRGVSAVSAEVAWASGNRGTVLRTVDGGATWARVSPAGTEALDFRDIEALDAETAYVLAIGSGDQSRILKTTDGGRRWATQFVNDDPRKFFDAIAFWDAQRGLAVGDPVDGRFTVIRTTDGGATWVPVPAAGMPPALEGDGAFAASGTCLVTHGAAHAWFGSGGGARARVYRSADRGLTWRVSDTPLTAGSPSAGIFSLAFADVHTGLAVGGDYRNEGESSDNLARTTDGGVTWSRVGLARLRGFRSAVLHLPGSGGRTVLTVGPAGTDRSEDGGATWIATGDRGFHAMSVARDGAVWAVGEDGRLAAWRSF
jgi:photosystem II stability/assembly factor-like uncharacterized protein